MAANVFEKIRDAHSSGKGVTLSHADVELLLETLGKAFAKAEARFEHWQEIVSDYQRRTEDPLP